MARKADFVSRPDAVDGEHFIIDRSSPINLPVDEAEPLKDEMRAFVHCCESGSPALTHIGEALGVQKVLEAMQSQLVDVNAATAKNNQSNREAAIMMDIDFIDLKSQQSRIREKIEAGWKQVLDHGAYIMGPEIAALENGWAIGPAASMSFPCSSGTDALVLALMGLEIKPGEGVIVPSFTFAASAEVMPKMGTIPIFAEVERTSFNLDPKKLDDALAAGRAAGHRDCWNYRRWSFWSAS